MDVPKGAAPLDTEITRQGFRVDKATIMTLHQKIAPADTGAELLMRYEPSDHLARTKIKRTPPARTALAARPAHVTRLKAHSCGDEKAPGTTGGKVC